MSMRRVRHIVAPKLRQTFAAFLVFLTLFMAAGEARAQSIDWLLNLSDAGSDPTAAGGTITYQITVTNDGFDPAPATTISLAIPASTTFTGGTGVDRHAHRETLR